MLARNRPKTLLFIHNLTIPTCTPCRLRPCSFLHPMVGKTKLQLLECEAGTPLVTVKAKFQVTLPAKLRRGTDLPEGDMMGATILGDSILLRPMAQQSVRSQPTARCRIAYDRSAWTLRIGITQFMVNHRTQRSDVGLIVGSPQGDRERDGYSGERTRKVRVK